MKINTENQKIFFDQEKNQHPVNSIPLLQNGYTVISVDISSESLKKIKKTALSIGLKNVIAAKELPQKKIQIILGADALHHINMEDYLPIFYKKLLKGGKIIFSEPGAYNLFWY